MRKIEIVPSTHALPAGMTAGEWHGLVGTAVSSWNEALAGCGGLHLAVKAPAVIRLAQEDGQTALIFRGQNWCHNERCGLGTTFPLRTMAMTTTYPRGARGKDLREGDVELNGKALRRVPADGEGAGGRNRAREWQFVAPDGQGAVPLLTVVEHEIGHILGLRDGCGGKLGIGMPDPDGCRSETGVLSVPQARGNVSTAKAHAAAVCALHGARSGCALAGRSAAAGDSLAVVAALVLVFVRRRIGVPLRSTSASTASSTRPARLR